MNTFSLVAGILAVFATIGHFTMGRKLYYKPLKNTQMDEVVKATFQSLFHYMSVFQVLSSFILIMIGVRGSGCSFEPLLVLGFIAANYFFFGLTQLIIALTSSIKGAVGKLFQWIFWFLISLFTILALIDAWEYVMEWAS